MDNTGYIAITRQSSLLKELNSVANNVANMSTPGFKREGVVFSEHVEALDVAEGSISLATAGAYYVDLTQGSLKQTNGQFDLAIEGPGFFQIDTPEGLRLTRSGSFSLNAEGQIVTMDGRALLGDGGGPIVTPQGVSDFSIAADGTISADGDPIGRVGLVDVAPETLRREGANLFSTTGALGPGRGLPPSSGSAERAASRRISEARNRAFSRASVSSAKAEIRMLALSSCARRSA